MSDDQAPKPPAPPRRIPRSDAPQGNPRPAAARPGPAWGAPARPGPAWGAPGQPQRSGPGRPAAERPGDRHPERHTERPSAQAFPQPAPANRWEDRRDDRRQMPGHGPAAPKAPTEAHADGVRIAKLMTERGLASRREADAWIEAGWVKVNGVMAVLGQRAAADVQLDIDPRAQNQQAQRVTVLFHKPMGYVSGQAEDGYEPAAALFKPGNRWSGDRAPNTFHPGQARGLAPAGRLDIDSTGLLVLTQDGRIAKLLIGDETKVEKEYLVRVEPVQPGPVPESTLARLRHGLVLDDRPLRPARVSWQNEDQLRFVLREGRKRQIRRMCELVGLKVVGLKRVRIGSVVLGQLPVGQWRYLGPDERFI